MYSKLLFCFLCLLSFSCNDNASAPSAKKAIVNDTAAADKINPYATINAIPVPKNFERLKADSSSFAFWLRHVGLKKDRTVYLYNGTPKRNQTAQFAVLDISVENKDLQQCADAVMRLRAEYLFSTKRFNELIFKDNDNGTYQFDTPYNREHFTKYLDEVFGMCGTASLAKQLKHKRLEDIERGDVLIRGGFPGHAVAVMDVAVNTAGKKIYLLAQSYMPAQDIHLLNNPMDKAMSPWYEVNSDTFIDTPEYRFTREELEGW